MRRQGSADHFSGDRGVEFARRGEAGLDDAGHLPRSTFGEALGPAGSSRLNGRQMFDGGRETFFNDGDAGVVAAPDGSNRTLANFRGYTAGPGPAGLRIDDVPAPPDTNETNPIGARISKFMSFATAPFDYCYRAVKGVLTAAGVIDPLPVQYGDKAYAFARAYDDDVAHVQTRFQEADVLSQYPFRRGTILVWGNQNCSIDGSEEGRSSGHIEIVKSLNCADPTHPDRQSCPSITDRHYEDKVRTYDFLAVYARKRNQNDGQPCLRAFAPRTTTDPAKTISI